MSCFTISKVCTTYKAGGTDCNFAEDNLKASIDSACLEFYAELELSKADQIGEN